MNERKIYIKNRAHYHSEFDKAIRKGFVYQGDRPKGIPVAMIFNLITLDLVVCFKLDYSTEYCKDLEIYSDVPVIEGVSFLRVKKNKPKKEGLKVYKLYPTVKDAIRDIKEQLGADLKPNKVYDAIKREKIYYGLQFSYQYPSLKKSQNNNNQLRINFN